MQIRLSDDIYGESVLAHPAAIRAALGRIRARLLRLLGPGERSEIIELVLAEVFNNIAEHALNGEVDGEFSYVVRLSRNGIEIEVWDRGRAMPDGPTVLGGMSDGLLPSQPEEGGYGCFLIRTLAEEVIYERRDGENRLRLRFAQSIPA